MDLIYTQQFSVEQTPLKKLLPILRQNAGDRKKLRQAFAGAFFKSSATPEKIAGNTVISLHRHGYIDPEGVLTEKGTHLVGLTEDAAAIEIAKSILKTHGGFQLVETLREMRDGGHERTIGSITVALRQSGLEVSDNSSDLSSLASWLRLAGVLVGKWDVDDKRYAELVGVQTETIAALKDLNSNQIAFLRALLALGVTDLTLYTDVVKHAEQLFAGQTSFNWKTLDKDLLKPLESSGLIKVQRAAKTSAESRGGKPALVCPTKKFEADVATPILESLFKNSHVQDLRKIRSTPWRKLVDDIKQNADNNLKGKSLEMLAIKFCMLLGLEFVGIRKTEENVTAGGEVDAIMQSTGLIFSRWQIQCKATDKITYEMIAKEYGVAAVSLASVIMIVSTGKLTPGADRYRSHLTQKSPLNIIVVEGDQLEQIVARPAAVADILQRQAERARRIRDQHIPMEAPTVAPQLVAPVTPEEDGEVSPPATEPSSVKTVAQPTTKAAAKPSKKEPQEFELSGD